MVVVDVASGEQKEALIEKVTVKELKSILKGKERYKFDWSDHKGQELYKLRLKDEKKILGIMSITDHTDELTDAIEINLLEVGAENVGLGKSIDKIGGGLIAFACRESFKRGHKGFIFLVPKSVLIKHYPEKYGFTHVPFKTLDRPEGIMTLDGAGSIKLIKTYL